VFKAAGASRHSYKRSKPQFLKSWKKITGVHKRSKEMRNEFKEALQKEKSGSKNALDDGKSSDSKEDMLIKIG